jgi:two-component sensor histidine kinase
MTHQFRPGQMVRLCRSRSTGAAPAGDYKVVRQLPETSGELQYRVKSMRESHERVVRESDLERAS